MAKKVNLRNYIIGASIGMVYLERGQFRNENVLMADGCSQHFLFLIFGWTKYTAYQIILCWCQIIKLSLYFFPNMCDSRNFGHQTVETVLDFILEGSTITTDGDCSHEINRCLLLGRKVMTTGKTIALTRQTFVGKVMSLLLNMLSTLVITFLPRSKHLLISWLQWFWSPRQ